MIELALRTTLRDGPRRFALDLAVRSEAQVLGVYGASGAGIDLPGMMPLKSRDREPFVALEDDFQDVPAGETLFNGPWQWAVYEVTSTQDALDWASRGAGLIESFQACELAASLGKA